MTVTMEDLYTATPRPGMNKARAPRNKGMYVIHPGIGPWDKSLSVISVKARGVARPMGPVEGPTPPQRNMSNVIDLTIDDVLDEQDRLTAQWQGDDPPHRRRHRPDYKDWGSRAGAFRGGTRDDKHRRFSAHLHDRGISGPLDEVKTSLDPRDLLGTMSQMELDRLEFGSTGRVLIPSDLSDNLRQDAARLFPEISIVVIPFKF